MNKSELIKHLHQEVYCRLSTSTTAGVGVFAVRDIPANTDPFQGCFQGDYHPFSDEELSEFTTGVQKMVRDYCVNIEGLWYIPENGLNSLDLSFFINHSSTPNVGTKDGEVFVTLTEIKSGQELFVDYDTYSEGLN